MSTPNQPLHTRLPPRHRLILARSGRGCSGSLRTVSQSPGPESAFAMVLTTGQQLPPETPRKNPLGTPRKASDDVRRWEAAHGMIPSGAIVLLRTGGFLDYCAADENRRWLRRPATDRGVDPALIRTRSSEPRPTPSPRPWPPRPEKARRRSRPRRAAGHPAVRGTDPARRRRIARTLGAVA